jgi:intracellular sulfur oxidation DsrE/DsrF family protein
MQMSFKSFINFSAIALLMILGAGSAAMAADAGPKHHVVFHVTDNDTVKWNQALNNMTIMKKKFGNDIEIEMVANGPGLDMLKFDSVVGNRMKDAIAGDITLYACGNTMKAAKMTEKDLYPGVKVVPGGIGEIMKRQEEGWTYIKI